jgi:hypothetical protein
MTEVSEYVVADVMYKYDYAIIKRVGANTIDRK